MPGSVNKLYSAPGNNEADQQDIKQWKEVLEDRLRREASTLPVGSEARTRLEAQIGRVRSARNIEELNSISTDAGQAGDDAPDASEIETINDHYEEYRGYNHPQYWDDYARYDFYNNPYVDPETQKVREQDLEKFARHFNLDADVVKKHSDISKNDSHIHNNPDALALSGGLSKIDPRTKKENMAAKTTADLAANDATGIGRNLPYMTPAAREKFIAQLGVWEKSQTLTGDEKKTIAQFRHLVDRGYLSNEAIAAMKRGDTFNNIGEIKKHVDEAQQRYRNHLTEAARNSSPDEMKRLNDLAREHGVPMEGKDGQPRTAGDILADLRAKQRHGDFTPEQNHVIDTAFKPISQQLAHMRGRAAYGNVMDQLSKNPEEMRKYLALSPEQRADRVEQLYRQARGEKMPPEMLNVVRSHANLLGTREQVQQFQAAFAAAQQGDPTKLDSFYHQRLTEDLQEKAKSDPKAAEQLKQLESVGAAVRTLRETDPALAKRLTQELRNAASDSVTNTGKVDTGALVKIIDDAKKEAAHAVSAAPNDQLAQIGIDRLKVLNAIAVPAAHDLSKSAANNASPASSEHPMLKAISEAARALPAVDQNIKFNPVSAPSKPADALAKTTEQKADEAAKGAKDAGTSGGKEASHKDDKPVTTANAKSKDQSKSVG